MSGPHLPPKKNIRKTPEETPMTTMLTSGDQFPDISLTSVTGDTLSLPADLETPYTIVLFYRGHW